MVLGAHNDFSPFSYSLDFSGTLNFVDEVSFAKQWMDIKIYSTCQENKDTETLVEEMAMNELAPAIIKECCDPKKALSDYVTSIDGIVQLGPNSNRRGTFGMHCGKNATNNPEESTFAYLTCQVLDLFLEFMPLPLPLLFGHARINGDFKRDLKEASNRMMLISNSVKTNEIV